MAQLKKPFFSPTARLRWHFVAVGGLASARHFISDHESMNDV